MKRAATIVILLLFATAAQAQSGPRQRLAELDDKLKQDPERIEWLLERAALYRLRGDFGRVCNG